jgi:hypothetical protein
MAPGSMESSLDAGTRSLSVDCMIWQNQHSSDKHTPNQPITINAGFMATCVSRGGDDRSCSSICILLYDGVPVARFDRDEIRMKSGADQVPVYQSL